MAVLELSRVPDLSGIMTAVKRAARELTASDGVTFVLREGDMVFYGDEDAIGPLWKGRRFPASACISGWAMFHRQSVVIEDIYADDRIPRDLYLPTFVKSLAMVPIRKDDPIGAIGVYWASRRRPSANEVGILESLAACAASAVSNAELLAALRSREQELAQALCSEQAARREAEAALLQRDEFLAIASHELRTPLTALQLDVASFVRAGQFPADSKQLPRLNRVDAQVRKLDVLIGQLLDVSKIVLGRLAIEPREVDAAELISEAAARFADLARSAGSCITVHDGGPALGCWDPERLDQVLGNLLSNAIKYGERRPVAVRWDANQEAVRISVQDSGTGIAAEDQGRIFERFVRTAAASGLPGLGLGLWITREIVREHGGRIWVTSTVGQGSTFTVELPRRLAALPRRRQRAAKAAKRSGSLPQP